MKILAFSDLHGRGYNQAAALIERHRPDWIVLLGDILPDFAMLSGHENRLACQRDHWNTHRSDFVSPNCPTMFIRGNHELEGFVVPGCHQESPNELKERFIWLEGYPADGAKSVGGRSLSPEQLEAELQAQLEATPHPMVVLSHVPPYGCLDQSEPWKHIGHRPLASWLESRKIGAYGLVLCGHVHESFGVAFIGEQEDDRTLVVNLAGGYALVDFVADGRWRIHTLQTLDQLTENQDLMDDDLERF